ncbi:MAG: hypothetical protein ACYSOQ_04430 [Planctomycetota bacterium]
MKSPRRLAMRWARAASPADSASAIALSASVTACSKSPVAA